ncbi:hypothetical protein HWV62_41703 [Athelia sp. TMB]|nr:hypothetical protein HWV62_41703 [Athelia sp. TMB]
MDGDAFILAAIAAEQEAHKAGEPAYQARCGAIEDAQAAETGAAQIGLERAGGPEMWTDFARTVGERERQEAQEHARMTEASAVKRDGESRAERARQEMEWALRGAQI